MAGDGYFGNANALSGGKLEPRPRAAEIDDTVAGWRPAPDRAGMERFHDGTRWTERYRGTDLGIPSGDGAAFRSLKAGGGPGGGSRESIADGFTVAGVASGVIGILGWFSTSVALWFWIPAVLGAVLATIGFNLLPPEVAAGRVLAQKNERERKQQEQLQAQEAAAPERLVDVAESTPAGPACPACGSTQFMPRRSAGRRTAIGGAALVAGPLGAAAVWGAAGKNLVECVACSAVYRRC